MMKIRVGNLWVCNLQNYLIYFLIIFISNLLVFQCQIIRKSIELPVKNYLSSPIRTGRDNWNARDQIYLGRDNSDSVRNFDHLPPHTPASALVFSGQINDFLNVGPTIPTPLFLTPTIVYNGRSGRNSFPPSTTSTKSIYGSTNQNNNLPFNINSLLQTSLSNTNFLEREHKQTKKGVFAAVSTPTAKLSVSRDSFSEVLKAQLLSTPATSPTYNTNDAVFGYFSKLPASTVTSREDRVDQMVESVKELAQYSNKIPHSEFSAHSYEKETQPHSFSKQKHPHKYRTSLKTSYKSNPSEEDDSSLYYSKEMTRPGENFSQSSGESNDYENSSGRGETDYSQEEHKPNNYYSGQSSEYRGQSNESSDYDSPPLYNPKQRGSAEYYRQSNEYYDYDSRPYSQETPENATGKQPYRLTNEQPYNQQTDGSYKPPQNAYNVNLTLNNQEAIKTSKPGRNNLPTVPPTIGIIGWKSNKDLETTWRPSKGPMNIPDEFIRENSKDNAYNSEITTTVKPPVTEGENQIHSQNQEEYEEEEEEEEDEESEDEEESEDGEEEGDEEESEGEEYEQEDNEPQNPSSKYENSSEHYERPQYSPQYRNEKSKTPYSYSNYYEEEEPLPPGPPYSPPPNLKGDPRTNGYIPFPSLGLKPRNRVENGVQEPWKPITPLSTVATKNSDDYKVNEKYKSEIDRWLYEGASVFDFPKEKDFQGWTKLNGEKSKIKLDKAESSSEFLKSKQKRTDTSGKKLSDLPKKPTERDRIESKELPVEHRHNNHAGVERTLKERKTSVTSAKEKPSDTNYRHHSWSQGSDEKDDRNRVSDHELPREVSTRVEYPGPGAWAKPKPGTGVDLEFVPKKVYTQTRKYKTVTHLPQEAAVEDASTPEEKLNAPRLREAISHKKVQQVYEEEGYEDRGYDHGVYKKHGRQETHVIRPAPDLYSSPEVIWGIKSHGGPQFNQHSRIPAPFSKNAEESSSGFKPIIGRHKYSSKLKSSVAPYVSFEVDDGLLDLSGYDVDRPSKERKSRDLSSLVQDEEYGEVFTRSAASVREIEHTISSQSGSGSEVQPTARNTRREDKSSTAKKYKEIVRNTSHSQEETGEKKMDRALRVNVKEDELNIRHPFLPRDGNGEVHIDYVQSRTRLEPDFTSPRRKYEYNDDAKLPVVTENPTTTTTPKVTTAKSTTTTTEYTPEDPSKVLNRLKSNLFLSSVFPTQESLEQNIDQYVNFPTTTTPKVTTYRGKTTSTTEETSSNETPEDTLDRLKLNPFLSSIIKSSIEATEGKRSQPKRGVRVKHVVVNPRNPNSMTDSSVKHVEQLTLAQYSGPSHGLMYTQIPSRTQQRIYSLAKHLNDEGIEPKHIVVRRSVHSGSEKTDESSNPFKPTIEDSIDVGKYPFYYSPASVSFPKMSPLRYALNPSNIPSKTHNGMEFYELRDKKVRCYEPTSPKDVVPSRQKNGAWNKNPQYEKQRLEKLGDQIDCLKVKYFGDNPLDNPLFKEENVSIPNFRSPSTKDSLEFYYDVVKNINSHPENPEKSSKGSQKEKEDNTVFLTGYNKPVSFRKDHNNKTSTKSKLTKYIYSSTYRNASKVNNTVPAESKHNTDILSAKNHTVVSTLSTNKTEPKQNVVYLKETSSGSQEFPVFPTSQEIQTGFIPIIPVVLQPPKDVTVSFKSKGTSNHPKIKPAKDNPTPYNINIKIVPKGTVGYLQSHNPFHIHDLASSVLGSEKKSTVKPVFIPDSTSSAARALTKVNKQPTTVTYLTINPKGDLLHKHIRTFVPVPSRAPTTSSPLTKYSSLESNDQRNWWNLHSTEYEVNKPIYRVKRSDENDKYINSKESLELKNYLLQKYKEILSQQTTESSTDKSSSERPITRTPTSTLKPFPKRQQRPPYSSQYTTISTVREMSSPEVIDEVRETKMQTHNSQTRPPIRRPKLRFPKLTMNTTSSTGDNQVKKSNFQDSALGRTLTTTKTTTTTTPTTTTTRMYKPRMSNRRELGKPREKVTDIFSVLKRQPTSSSTETLIPEPTTENVTNPDPISTKRNRKPMQNGFERPGNRRSFREQTTRRRISSPVYNKESSLGVNDHPDLRTPISRSSRNALEGSYNEMLVYMVNPTTGLGEWMVVPAPSAGIPRMNTRLGGNENHYRNQNSRKTTNRRRTLRPEPTYEYYKSKYMPKDDSVQEGNKPDTNQENYYQTTAHWSQMRSQPSSYFQSKADTGRELEESAPQIVPPEQTNSHNTGSTSTIPKIIMEPFQRQYYYVKI